MKPSLRQKSTFSKVATRVLLPLSICLLVAGVIFTATTTAPAQSAATIAPSQKLYSVGETMVINGQGFSPNANIYLTVLRPDHLTDSVLPLPLTNGSGVFTASYTPPLLPGRYRITATDGTNTAVTAVTEADAIGYNKGVYNKSATTPEDTTGNWTTGNAGSHYLENQWSFYQYEITGVGSTVPSFDVTFNHFQANTNAIFVDALADFRACIDCTDSSNTSGPSQGMLLDTDPLPPSATTNWVLAASAVSHINRPLNSAADGSGTTVLTGSTGFCSSDTKEPIPDLVTTFPAQFHGFHVDGPTLGALFGSTLNSGTHTITLYYAAHLAASFVWGNGTAGVGGHEASLGDCTSPFYVRPLTGPLASFEPFNTTTCLSSPVVYGTDDYTGWTAAGFGVGFATGSSRHFSLSNQSSGPSGGIDLPIPTVAAPQNTIIIKKVTIPSNATGVTFPFTSSQLGNFSLTSPFPSSKTFTGIAGGVEFDVTESNVPGWTLQSVSCAVTAGTDDGTGTWPTSGSNPTAAITLGGTDSNVTLTCTYTNSGSGHIIVQKHTNPSGSLQSFAYTTTGTGYTGFSLTDGGSNTDGGTPPAGGLTPGTYTISENAVSGWVLTSRTCSLTTTGSGTSTFPASGTTQPASITLGAGDTVTCVYNNSHPDANITIGPATATNEVNTPHTFNITLTAIPNGASPVSFGTPTVSFVGTPPGTVGTVTCDTPSGNTDTCHVTINSSTAGTFTANACATITIGGVALNRCTNDGLTGDVGPAVKNYIAPATTLTLKSAPTSVEAGSTVTIVVTETNTGSDTLTNVNVTGTGGCAGGFTPASVTLAPLASQDFTCTFTAAAGANAWTALGHGTDSLGNPAPATNESQSGSVNGVSAATTLTLKSAPTSVEAGSTVTILVTETNPGNVRLPNVNVTGTGGCAGGFTPPSVPLAPLASQDFTCTFTAAAGANAWTALGHGTDSLGNPAPATNESQSGSVTGLLSTLIVVKHTVGGNGTFNFSDTGLDLPPGGFIINTSGGIGMMAFPGIHSGAKSVTETVPTGWLGNTTNVTCAETVTGITPSVIGTLTTGEVSAGGTITANITNLGIGATVRCDFTNALLPTLTIIKTIQGTGTATFTFPVTGDNTLNPTITPPTAPSTATFPPGPPTPPPGVVLNVGSNGTTSNNTITESGPPAGWTLTDFTCTGYTGGGTGAGPLNSNGVPTSWNFNANFGDNVVCTFVNNNAQATRTQGFWATHTALANEVWGGNGTTPPPGVTPVIGSPDDSLCGVQITALTTPPGENVLMGGFWANVANTSTKTKRSAIDHARMVLLQQYLAAVLNVHMFGSGSEAMLAAARAAYCGNDQQAIQQQTGILDAFNSQGDNLGTTPGGSATPS